MQRRQYGAEGGGDLETAEQVEPCSDRRLPLGAHANACIARHLSANKAAVAARPVRLCRGRRGQLALLTKGCGTLGCVVGGGSRGVLEREVGSEEIRAHVAVDVGRERLQRGRGGRTNED